MPVDILASSTSLDSTTGNIQSYVPHRMNSAAEQVLVSIRDRACTAESIHEKTLSK